MSFYVNLYTFTKEPNSTAQPTGTGTQHQCVSNTPFDVLHPNIPLNLGNAANPTAYNYCRIPDFQNRYYWIRTWTWEDGLWVAHCDVDPLASWKTAIGSTNAYVLRAAAASDGTIVDNLYPRTAQITTYNDIQADLWDTDPQTQGSYVVGIQGSSTINYYTMTPAELWVFMHECYSTDYYTAALGFFAITNQDMALQVDPMKYVASCVWLPFTAPQGAAANKVMVGTVDVTAFNGIVIYKMAAAGYSVKTVTFNVNRHPDAATRGSWLNAACAEYSITIPPFGTIKLDPVTVAKADAIKAYITVDHRTGAGVMLVVAEQTNGYDIIITKMTAQIGVSFPLSHITTPGAALASTMLPAVQALGGLMSMTSGTAGGVIGGAGSILGAAASALGDLAQTKVGVPSTTGGTPCVAQLTISPQMDYIWYYPVAEDNTHRGRPLCQVRQLSTLSGYQLCTNVDVQAAATREELDAIRTYLESGYYYE